MQYILRPLSRSKWIKNAATDFCNVCCVQIKPTLFKSNKHHCRYCGNIVCSNCSSTKHNQLRICDQCSKILTMSYHDFNASDKEIDHEELSPFNTPCIRSRECSIQPFFEDIDTIPEDTECIEYPPHMFLPCLVNRNTVDVDSPKNILKITNNPSASSENEKYFEREQDAKTLLVFGFLRECWKIWMQFNQHRDFRIFPGEQIIDNITCLLSVSDSLDEYHTNLNIVINNKPIYHLHNYRRVQSVTRTKEWDMKCYHSFGADTVSFGETKTWKLKISGYDNNCQRPCVLIGIIEASKVSCFSQYEITENRNYVEESDGSFNDERYGGYALYSGDWNIYHKTNEKGVLFTEYADGIDISAEDVITVELDLNMKYNQAADGTNCGTLKYMLNGTHSGFRNNGIAFKDIDIHKTYKLALGFYLRDKVDIYQVL